MNAISKIDSPDEFTSLCKHLLAAEYEDFESVDDSGGDEGNDGYSQSHKMLFQIYCPEKPAKITDAKFIKKIDDDLEKAKKLADSGDYEIKKWVFVTPMSLRVPVLKHLRNAAAKHGFVAMSWSDAKLSGLLATHHHLRKLFTNLIQDDLEKLITDLSRNTEDTAEVKKKYKTKIEQQYTKRIENARRLLDEGKFETAKKHYEEILVDLKAEEEQIDPHLFFRVYNNLGVSELNLKNYPAAALYFKESCTVEPSNVRAVGNRALSLLLDNKAVDGLKDIERSIKSDPGNKYALSIKANILYSVGKHDELAKLLKDNNEIALMHFYAGLKSSATADHESAVVSFEKTIEIDPTNINAYLFASQNILQSLRSKTRTLSPLSHALPKDVKEKFKKSASLLKEAIKQLENKEQKAELEMAYTNLSGTYAALSRSEDALLYADKAIDLNKSASKAYLNKGVVQLKTGDYNAAISNLQKYIDLDGDDTEVNVHLAYCLQRTGDIDKAESIITSYLQTSTNPDPQALEIALDVYTRTLQHEKRDALIKRLETEFPNSSQMIRIRANHLKRIGSDEAADLYKKSMAVAKNDAEKVSVEIDYADYLYGKNEFEEASDLYIKYLSTQDVNPGTIRYALCLYNTNKYGKLLSWIENLAPKVQTNTTILELKAYSNLTLNNLAKASVCFGKLYKQDPTKLQYLVYYGICKFRIGKEQDVKEAFDLVKSKITTTQDLIALTGGYQFIGEHRTALELSHKALTSAPNDQKANEAFIYTFLRAEQSDKDFEFDPEHIKTFQQCLGEFETKFPGQKSLKRIEIEGEDLSPMFNVVDRVAESGELITKLYSESKVPLATIPKFMNRKSFDIWAALIQNPTAGLKIAFGSAAELKNESEIISSAQDGSIALDIYPLFLLAYLDRLNLLNECFKKLYVHQSILDEINAIIDEKKISEKTGATMLAKINGQHQAIETPPEQIKKTRSLAEKVKKFLTDNPKCEIVGLSQEHPEADSDALEAFHESTKHPILLAKELKIPIYCDDRLIRSILKQNHGIEGFSSLSLIDLANEKSILSDSELRAMKQEMIRLNYDFVSINASFLLHSYKDNDLDVTKIEPIIRALVQKDTDIKSLATVIGDLYVMMIKDGIDVNDRSKILRHIIKAAKQNHDSAILEDHVFNHLKSIVPPAKHQILRDALKMYFAVI